MLESKANFFTFLIFLVSQVLMDSSCESTRGSSQNFWMGPPRSRGSSVPAIAFSLQKKCLFLNGYGISGVVDRHRFEADPDPDPAFHSNGD
jgi:hypothetical protein